MERGRAARGCARGGDGIQAPRATGTRVALALGSVAAAGAAAVAPALRVDEYGPALAAPGALAVVLLAAGLALGRSAVVPAALLLLGGEYAGSLFLGVTRPDGWAPAEAVALLLVAELGYWAVELRPWIAPTRGVLRRRASWIAGLVVASLGAAAAVLAAATAPIGAGILWETIGVAAATGVFALLARLARR